MTNKEGWKIACVIIGCATTEQLDVAKRYAGLASARWPLYKPGVDYLVMQTASRIGANTNQVRGE